MSKGMIFNLAQGALIYAILAWALPDDATRLGIYILCLAANLSGYVERVVREPHDSDRAKTCSRGVQ